MKVIHFCLILIGSTLLNGCFIFAPSPEKTNRESLKKAPYDAIIVPGVPFEGKHWSEAMQMRVQWANYLYKKGITKNIIYSGSAVYTEYEEAKIMALYGEALGIPKEHIFTDPRAEHSTENVYYSYQVAKKQGFKKIALATDPFQLNGMRKFIKKFEFPIDLLPIIKDTLLKQDLSEPQIDPSSAKRANFVSIVDRQSKWQRLRGTFGQHIRWQEEDLKTKHLRKKYADRIEN
ncbi:YdcF family protein [Fluviicola sp.]|uniref:YdcF family protein n=1 Tax=Fluviicola sp. TaxID=1917219 RepID=UPI0026215DE5|nr:YdcF family protein [Fluviicola sp.]